MLSIKDSTNNIFLIHKREFSPQYLKSFIREMSTSYSVRGVISGVQIVI